MKLTFEEFCEKMREHCKQRLEDAGASANYPGDAYYSPKQTDLWEEQYHEGMSPEDVVDEDMSYWD